MAFNIVEIIAKKKKGSNLTSDEISELINRYRNDEIPDYQMSALLMSICWRGMSSEETRSLTQTMRDSGIKYDWSEHSDRLGYIATDKHSSGGVGDKTSLLIAPLLICAGLPVPMMAGRGLGHTGGTIDKLESFAGFKTVFEEAELHKLMREIGGFIIGQSREICPADRKLYALRDITATVDSIPLICASILSKKLAAGVQSLVLDIKCGSGGFMKNIAEAQALARNLIDVSQGAGCKTLACITNMNQVLGRFGGNFVEIGECLSVLSGKPFMGMDSQQASDMWLLSRELTARALVQSKRFITLESAHAFCDESIRSGAAYEIFEKMIHAQGGEFPSDWQNYFAPQGQIDIRSKKAGFVQAFDTEQIGYALIEIDAGRKTLTSQLNLANGMQSHVKIGDPVKIGQTVMSLHFDPRTPASHLMAAQLRLEQAMSVGETKPETEPLIYEVMS